MRHRFVSKCSEGARGLCVALLILFAVPVAAQDKAAAGFTCSSASGATKLMNIDLRKRKFDEGTGFQKIPEANATTIVLRRSGPETLGDNAGLVPMFENLSLDRRTLVLTHWLSAPRSDLNRSVSYQCVMGPLINFSAGVKF